MSEIIKNPVTKSPLKIGITGGIGSGKTTVCKVFESMGIPVYYADDRAKWLMVNNIEVVNKLKSLFGKKVYLENGKLNKAHIASIVFNDKVMLQKLNSIVHPAVYQDGLEWQQAQIDVPYTLKEAALLFEAGSYKALDKIVTVFAPKEIRLGRVMKRDHISESEVIARMNKQMDDFKKMYLADFVIFNDGKHPLLPQIQRLHKRILKL